MYERFIVTVTDKSDFGGCYGIGDTLDAAMQNCKGSKRAERRSVCRFVSELPFAPTDRTALDHEADAWVDRYGGINWLRCEREVLS